MQKIAAIISFFVSAMLASAAMAQGVSIFSSTAPVFTQTSAVTVANTVAETTLLGTGKGNLTLPANYFAAGRSLRIDVFGIHSATGNPTIRIKIKFNSTIVLDTTAVTSGNSTNNEVDVRALVTCTAVGGSGTFWGQGRYIESGGGASIFAMENTSAVTVDTTIPQTIDVTVTWGTASASNTITATNVLILSSG